MGYMRLDEGSLTETSFVYFDLTAGTTYFYWVRAVNSAGEAGGWSDRKDATVPAASSSD